MSDRLSASIRRTHTVFEVGRRIGRLIVASVRLGWRAEKGSTVTGVTVVASSSQAETLLYSLDLAPRPISRAVEIETERGWEMIGLDAPDTADGVWDV